MSGSRPSSAGARTALGRTSPWRWSIAAILAAALAIAALNLAARGIVHQREAEALAQAQASAQREARVLRLLWAAADARIETVNLSAAALARAIAAGDRAGIAALGKDVSDHVANTPGQSLAAAVIGADGATLWRAPASSVPPQSFAGRAFFRAIVEQGADAFTETPNPASLGADATTVFARAVRDPAGTLLGIAAVFYRSLAPEAFRTELELGEAPLYGIWRGDGSPIAVNDIGALQRGWLAHVSGNCPAAAPAAGGGRTADGVQRAIVVECLDDTGAFVAVAASTAPWLAAAQGAATTIWLLAGVASGLIAVAGGLAVRLLRQTADARAAAARETALRADQGLFRDLLDHIGDTLLKSVGDELIVEYISPGARKLLGAAPEQLVGRSIRRVPHPSDWSKVDARAASLPSGQAEGRMQYRYVRPDGRQMWIEAETVVVRSEQGNTYYSALRDVTEKYEAHVALEQAKTELDTLLAIIPGVLCRTEIDAGGARRLTYVSPGIAQFTGMTVEEARGPNGLLARIAPGLFDEVDRALAASSQPGQATIEFPSPYVTSPRRQRRAHIRRIDLPDGRGEEIWYLVAITDLHAAEQARRAAELRLAELVERSPAVLFQYVVDESGAEHSRYHSPNVAALTGYPPDLLDRPDIWYQLVDPETVARWPAVRAQALATGQAQWEYPVKIADGRIRRMLSSCRAERRADGTWLLTGSMLDVTAQRATERELERTRRDLEAAVEAGPGALLRIRLHPDQPPRVLFASGALARITGYTAQDSSVADWLGQALDANGRETLAAGHRAALDMQPGALDLRFRHRSGEWRWMQLTLHPMERTSDGGAILVCYMLDVTQQKEQDERRAHNAKLVTLGEMTTSLAHELNQPLAIMSMAAENAKADLARPDRAAALSARLDRIHAQALRASRLIEHLRVFGRSQETGPAAVSAEEVVSGALLLAGGKLRDCGVAVQQTVPEGLPALLGNQLLLEQVVLNLISNACDAYELADERPPPGKRVVAIGACEADGQIVLSVADHAGGIPEAIIGRVFEPFFTTKSANKGTGVGLSFSYGVVSDMGGTLRARNAGGGAIFELSLPRAAGATRIEPARTSS